ncbi:hypothetical protein [Xanthomonas bundabergensis]|uniref:hypothetical protein n=1 Tax=Xanthomonas bundabergensis TaxID=3160842 RepID=UPI003511B920
MEAFRACSPDRDKVETGFAIEGAGGRSEQIEIIVFDRHCMPTSLDRQPHRYAPRRSGVRRSRPSDTSTRTTSQLWASPIKQKKSPLKRGSSRTSSNTYR